MSHAEGLAEVFATATDPSERQPATVRLDWTPTAPWSADLICRAEDQDEPDGADRDKEAT
jgi:hypothetical protein